VDKAILLDPFGRPYEAGLMTAPHPVVPPFPTEWALHRSGEWPKFLHNFLKAHPNCMGCNRKAETGHHDKPFHEHPELELDPLNIDPVCVPCHFVLCHAGDWRLIVDDARKRLKRNLLDMKDTRRLVA
jgi:hypothetical protein